MFTYKQSSQPFKLSNVGLYSLTISNMFIICQQKMYQSFPLVTHNMPFSQSLSDIPRQGPILRLNRTFLEDTVVGWCNRALAVLIDSKSMPIYRPQIIIETNWLLQDEVRVITKYANFYVLEFDNLEDLEFMTSNGPWTVQKCLLEVTKWRTNLSMTKLRVDKVAIWFRFYGLPMELITDEMAMYLGQIKAT